MVYAYVIYGNWYMPMLFKEIWYMPMYFKVTMVYTYAI